MGARAPLSGMRFRRQHDRGDVGRCFRSFEWCALGCIELMLSDDDPLFPNWDQDASALDDRYESQVPELVLTELIEAAEALASRLDAVTDDEWDRPGRRSDGASFTVDSIARYMVHDTIHHVGDFEQQCKVRTAGRDTSGLS